MHEYLHYLTACSCADQLLPGRGAQLGPLSGRAGACTERGGSRAAGLRARAARARRDQPGQPDRTGAHPH